MEGSVSTDTTQDILSSYVDDNFSTIFIGQLNIELRTLLVLYICFYIHFKCMFFLISGLDDHSWNYESRVSDFIHMTTFLLVVL